ncbi:hypothetical protein XELAEV_18033037mg [Xenopus laevis]|uniref:Uncharacterized protein n=1 Tax=Xenopus laevis TaxID=8355 RepID=A0A974HDL1_XENLA|nr:hypothetical protein XELAEV_18033037mg [Xenopus laevis]
MGSLINFSVSTIWTTAFGTSFVSWREPSQDQLVLLSSPGVCRWDPPCSPVSGACIMRSILGTILAQRRVTKSMQCKKRYNVKNGHFSGRRKF